MNEKLNDFIVTDEMMDSIGNKFNISEMLKDDDDANLCMLQQQTYENTIDDTEFDEFFRSIPEDDNDFEELLPSCDLDY
jgi:hypothetical protein